MAESLPFQISYQGAGPLDARSVVEDTTESELASHIQGSSTAFVGQLLSLPAVGDDGATYVVTDPSNGRYRRYDGPRVVNTVSENDLQSWIANDANAYPGERLWLPDAGPRGGSFLVLDAAAGDWERIGGPRVVDATRDSFTQTIKDGTFYDSQIFWGSRYNAAYIVVDATNGEWRRFDGPRVVDGVFSEEDLATYISGDASTFNGQRLWLTAEGGTYVVVDASSGAWRKVSGPRVLEGYYENDLTTAIGNGKGFAEGEVLWVPNETAAYLVTDASSGEWRRLDARLIVEGQTESDLASFITSTNGIHDSQVLWLVGQTEAYLVVDASTGRWRRLDGLEVVRGTAEADLTSWISTTTRISGGQDIWLVQESSLYRVLDPEAGTWDRVSEPRASRVVVTDQDVTVTPEDEGRLFLIDTFTKENDGYGAPRSLTLPGDAVGEGWEIRVLLDGDMHLQVNPGSNATIEGDGQYVSEMGREVRIVCRSSGTYRVESLRRGLDLQSVTTTYRGALDRGYELDGPVPQIDTAYIPKSGQLWFTKHGSKSSDTRAGSVFVVGTLTDTDYEIAAPFGMPVTMAYHPIADKVVTFDADARDAVIFDAATYPDSQPTTTRTGTVSSIASGDTLYPLTSEWIGTDTVVIVLLEPSTPELLEFRVDISAGTKSESTTTSVGSSGDTFYREPRRSVVDRQRGYVYLVADAAAYVVDPSDWLTPLVTINLEPVSDNPDFWNGCYVDDRVYLFESGYVDSNVEPDSVGGGVAGTVATIDPHRWRFEDRYPLQIEGGESVEYVGPLDVILGCPAEYGNLEVYSPELNQTFQRITDDEVPGAVVHLSQSDEVAYINQTSVISYSY
jgi:hypothetical protein